MTPKVSLVTLALLCVSPFCASIAQGQTTNIVFANPGFEGINASVASPVLLGTNTGSLGAWAASATGVIAVGSSVSSGSGFGVTPLEGTFAARFSFGIGVGNVATLSQNSSVNLVSNSRYQLTIDVNPGSFLGAIGGLNVSLTAGGVVIPGATLTGASLVSLLNANSATFQTVSFSFDTGGAAPTGLLGVSINAGGLALVAGNFYVDNVRLTQTPIPEPSTVVASLAGAGMLGLVMRRRRALA